MAIPFQITGGVQIQTDTNGMNMNDGWRMSADGTKVLGLWSGNKTMREWRLNTPYDLTTSQFIRQWANFSSTGVYDTCFSQDGFNFYTACISGTGIKRFSMSVAWDLGSVITYRGLKSLNWCNFISFDGTKFYEAESGLITQFNLNTPYDHRYWSSTKTTTIFTGTPTSMFITDDGLHVYLSGHDLDNIVEYELTIAWDISTMVATGRKEIYNGDGIAGIQYDPSGTTFIIYSEATGFTKFALPIPSAQGNLKITGDAQSQIVQTTGALAITATGKANAILKAIASLRISQITAEAQREGKTYQFSIVSPIQRSQITHRFSVISDIEREYTTKIIKRKTLW